MNDNSDNRLLNLGEISEAIRLPAGWIRKGAGAGRIPCIRVGHRLVFNETAVREAIANSAATNVGGTRRMAQGSPASGVATSGRRTHSQDAGRSLDQSGAHDGERMADSAESPASQRHSRQETSAGLGHVRSVGSFVAEVQNVKRGKKRVVPMGEPTPPDYESLHPEERPPLVESVRPTGPVTTESVSWLLEFQHYRCALTGRSLTPDSTALDHVLPIRRGGEHVIENAQALHKDVNRAKGSLTTKEFVSLCREVVRWCDAADRAGASETANASSTSQPTESLLSGETS